MGANTAIPGGRMRIAKRTALGVLMLAIFSGEAFGFTVNDWNGWNEATRLAYLAGVLDTWEVMVQVADVARATLFDPFRGILSCRTSRKMPNRQIFAIVEKYVKDNPARWNYSIHDSIFGAMHDACQ